MKLFESFHLVGTQRHNTCVVLSCHCCDECRCCASVCRQGAAAYPDNEDQQQRLREAAEGLRVATNAAAQNAIKKKLVNRLEVSDRYSVTDIPVSAVSGKICV